MEKNQPTVAKGVTNSPQAEQSQPNEVLTAQEKVKQHRLATLVMNHMVVHHQQMKEQVHQNQPSQHHEDGHGPGTDQCYHHSIGLT